MDAVLFAMGSWSNPSVHCWESGLVTRSTHTKEDGAGVRNNGPNAHRTSGMHLEIVVLSEASKKQNYIYYTYICVYIYIYQLNHVNIIH